MGTFGGGSFENDEALDFVATVQSSGDISAVFSAMPKDPEISVDADEAQRIIAAVDCVATMMGRPAEDIPASLEKRVAKLGAPPPELVEIARDSLSRILRSSELADLWAEDDPKPFNRAMTLLIDRLNPEISPRKTRKKDTKTPAQICAFCDNEIELAQLYSFDVSCVMEEDEFGSGIRRGAWCHLTCLNERLHPKHLVQNWRFSPEEIKTQARNLLDLDE